MNFKKTIPAGEPWQINGDTAAFYTEEAATLSFSVDGKNYADYDEAIEADTNVFVNGCVPGMYLCVNKDVIALY